MMERRVTGNCHARCGVGENPAIVSKDYLSLFGQIPDFDKVIAFVRSMGMSLNVIVQNLAQLKARYEKTWEVITGNCDSLLFLGGKEESTLKFISEALGKETIDVRGQNRTKGKQSSTSENNSILGRELMQQNEISTMPISDCILMIRSHNPFYCTKFPIEQHPNYKFLEDYDKANAFDVKTVHSVSVAEFMKQQQRAAYSTNPESIKSEQAERIESIFRNDELIEITFDTYEDAEMYADADNSVISEEYIDDSPKYGEISDFDSLDLGEAVRKPREEVEDYEGEPYPISLTGDGESEADETSENSIEMETQYITPDDVQSLDNLEEVFDESITEMTEQYAETALGLYDDEGFGMYMDDVDML